MSVCALCVKAGEGVAYPWKSDHAFVKVSAKDSAGAFTLIEDNLTTEFVLPRHCHYKHTETFYVISGKVKFVLDDREEILGPNDTLHVPKGAPHFVTCLEPAKMLTIYEPGGLENLFEAYTKMSPEEMADPAKLRAIDESFDSVRLD